MHYCQFEIVTIPALKQSGQLSHQELKAREGELLLKNIADKNWVVVLDEQGQTSDSIGFAKTIEKWSVSGKSSIDFVIGGAFGFSEAMYQRANAKISLSAMTFSHQLVRLIFMEQLYRAFTILKNEPYHHV